MGIVDEIKDRLDILDLIGETVKLRRTGKNYTGFCPFHANTRTPAFVVFPETGTWRCFGACGEGGDIFKFVMKKEGYDFPEALRALAARAGVELAPRTPVAAETRDAHDRLNAALEAAALYYRHMLLNAPSARAAREHLAKRGLREGALEQFQIGYTPDSWEAGLSYLKGKGYSERELLDAGLVSERDSGGVYDRFRNRIMIPIRDARGRMAGFGARVLDPNDLPKFLNSPQTALFDKGALLYGLDRARKAIRETREAVIVEGYMDVIAAHQAGYANVVSPMGTALTETQLRLLKRYARRIVLALDPDEAGNRATLRGLDVARAAMDREAEPVFDPRGLVRYEGRLKADIRVLTLPDGLDPDEYLDRRREAWPGLVASARPIVEYVIDVLTKGRDLTDPKARSEIAEQVLPLIEDVADPLERDIYRQKLARLLRVELRTLLALRVARPAPRGPARRPASRPRPERLGLARPVFRLEAYCLGALVRQPELLYRADRALSELRLSRLTAGDFSNTEDQLIFGMVQAALDQVDTDPADYLQGRLDPTLGQRMRSVLDETQKLDLSHPRAVADVISALLRLRRRNIGEWLGELRYLAQEAQEQGDERAQPYADEILKQAAALAGVDQALGRQSRRAIPLAA